jgi:type IV secretion system protein VirD4
MFEDMALWRKLLFGLLCAIALPLIVPISSALVTFLLQYRYDHLLLFSMIQHRVNPVYVGIIIVLTLGFYVLIVMALLRMVSPKSSIYGDSRAATTREIKKQNLFEVTGESILLGYYGKKLVAFNNDLHVFLAAQTGTGKGVSFVIPNLLNWVHSCIVVDVKRDIHKYTSGFRKHLLKQKVYVFEPLSINTDCFNPLSFVSRDPDLTIGDLQKIASTLCPIHDEYYDGQARVLFVGLMQLLIEAHVKMGWQCSIGQVLRLMGTKQEIGLFLENTIGSLEKNSHPLTASCKSNLYSYINEPEKPRGSIRSSLVNHLQLWTNPRVDRATSHSTFDFETFRKTPQTLYIVASPSEIQEMSSLFRLLFDSFLRVNTKVGEQPRDQPEVFKHQVLLMMDEFISMGVMENVVHGLSYVRGWGIKVCTVIQGAKQLHGAYDTNKAEAFEDGHRARVFFRPPTANAGAIKELAEALGHYTGRSTSKSRSTFFSNSNNGSVSESDQSLYLQTPDQIRNMPDHRSWLMIDGLRPIYAKKINYYQDKYFKNRLRNPDELPTKLTTGDSIYPEEGVLENNEIKVLLPQGTIDEINSVFIPNAINCVNVGDTTESLIQVLKNHSIKEVINE